MHFTSCFYFLLATLVSSSIARAEAPPGGVAANTLTGNWGGARERLHQSGFDIDMNYRLDAWRNMAGGIRTGSAFTGLADAQMQFDLEQLWGWSGTRANVHLMDHSRGKINNDYVGSMTGVTNTETLRNSTKFYRIWIERDFLEARLALRAGLFPLEDEFFTAESASTLIHPTAGPQGDLAATHGPAIYNNAALGLRLKVRTTDRAWYAMAAVLDRPQGDTNNIQGMNIHFNRIKGAHLIGEIGHTPLADEKRKGGEAFDKTAVGLWRYTPQEYDLLDRNALGNPVLRINWGWYVLAEKTLYRWPNAGGRSLSGFIRLSGADGNTSPIERSVNLGLRVKGLLPDRENDIAAAMIAGHHMDDEWRQSILAAGSTPSSSENVLELNYMMAVMKWFSFQPMLQWITTPGGLANVKTARIAGARFSVAF